MRTTTLKSNFPATIHAIGAIWLGVLTAPGQTADQTIQSLNAGGGPSAGGEVVHYGCLGTLGELATAPLPLVNKTGFLGQLYEIDSLQLEADPSDVGEGASRQLAATQRLDDGSRIELDEATVTWGVQSGPISSVSAGGLATAGLVYQNTPGVVQGAYAGEHGTLDLIVVNTNLDNYGSYAGDGLDDDWQVLYFGLDNPLAAPGIDADGDGQNNGFEFVAGLIPTDRLSRFHLRIEMLAGFPRRAAVVFSPRFSDRVYTLQSSLDLAPGSWIDVPATTVGDDGLERTVTDTTDDGSTTKFYQLEVTRP